MPTEGSVKQVCTDGLDLLEEDTSKGGVVLGGDLNARVGKSDDVNRYV